MNRYLNNYLIIVLSVCSLTIVSIDSAFGQFRSQTEQLNSNSYVDTVQDNTLGAKQSPSPAGALIRSFVIPGWGHFYAGTEHKNRGLIHLGTDLALLGGYFGIRIHANNLEQNSYTFAQQHAGIDLKNRSREFILSVGEYGSLNAYNDFQERSRNWDRIYQTTGQNFWSWDSEQNRLSFLNMDTRVQDNRQQLPAIISLMVVNRLVAGISAFSRARQQQYAFGALSFSGPEYGGNSFTLVARYQISF